MVRGGQFFDDKKDCCWQKKYSDSFMKNNIKMLLSSLAMDIAFLKAYASSTLPAIDPAMEKTVAYWEEGQSQSNRSLLAWRHGRGAFPSWFVQDHGHQWSLKIDFSIHVCIISTLTLKQMFEKSCYSIPYSKYKHLQSITHRVHANTNG